MFYTFNWDREKLNEYENNHEKTTSQYYFKKFTPKVSVYRVYLRVINNTILVDPKPRDFYARYRVTATDLNNSVSEYSNEVVINVAELLWKKGEGGASEDGLPLTYGLSQNYPNPFNPSTTISFRLPENSHVSIKVFDLMGREVASLLKEYLPAGYHNVEFNASNLSSGIYIYNMTAGKFKMTNKLILIK
jgi:hypothetical protein